jgi:hypothetical protein
MRGEAGDVLAIHDDRAGGWWKNPAITLKSVVFPAPLGPISPVMDPVSIRQRRAIDGMKPAEMLVDVVNFDQRPMSPVASPP